MSDILDLTWLTNKSASIAFSVNNFLSSDLLQSDGFRTTYTSFAAIKWLSYCVLEKAAVIKVGAEGVGRLMLILPRMQ